MFFLTLNYCKRLATQETDILPQYEFDRKQKHTAVLSALQATDSAMFGCTLDTVTRPVWLDAIFEGLLQIDNSAVYIEGVNSNLRLS